MVRGLSKKSNILSVNVYIYIYCVVNNVVHSDTVLWCQPLIVCCLCVFVMLIYILFTAVCCQPLIVCCLSVFVRLICTLYSCVLSNFNCMLSLWFCDVYMYYMQMCAVNIWLYVVCVLLLCLYIYIYVLQLSDAHLLLLSVYSWYVYMYSIQLWSVNLWLYVVWLFLSG